VEQEWCGKGRARRSLFIVGGGGRGGAAGRQWRRRFTTRRGKAMGASCRRRLGGAIALDGLARGGQERAASSPSLRYRGGRGLIMATARALPRASRVVQELAGSVGMARARGQSEGRTRGSRRRRVLRRPECRRGALTACAGKVWTRAFWAMPYIGDRVSGTGLVLMHQRCSQT
jgi:hypothetical protein